MVTPWCSGAPAESRILSGVPWTCRVHGEAFHIASPWKAGLGEVGLCRWGSHQWQNWPFKIHIYLSASFGDQDCCSAGDNRGDRLHQTYRFGGEEERGRGWQERVRRWVKFRLPNSAEKVKNSFCLLVCGVAHRWEGVDLFVRALLFSLASRRSPYLSSCCQLPLSCPLSLCSAYISCCDFNYL